MALPRQRPSGRRFSPRTALGIGLAQVLSMVPGISRSGATIMGADARSLAAGGHRVLVLPGDPGHAGRCGLDPYKGCGALTSDGSLVIAVGFIAAFVTGSLVVRSLVAFVGRYGFSPFGWYRIVVGVVMLAMLSLR